MKDPTELAARYVAIWIEPDPARRRAAIPELFSEDAVHLLQPPQEIRAAAAELDVNPVFEARGHAELEARVGRAYEQWVAPGELSFRPTANAVRVGDAITFNWEMVDTGGAVQAVGREILLLAPDGRIRLDYQIIEA